MTETLTENEKTPLLNTPDQVAKIVERCSGPDAHWDYLTTYTADLINDLANLFAATDPTFNREKFLKGCGV